MKLEERTFGTPCIAAVSKVKKSHQCWDQYRPIDLFTDTAAILNLLDLRSIMGCPGSTRSVFTRAFRAKRERKLMYEF